MTQKKQHKKNKNLYLWIPLIPTILFCLGFQIIPVINLLQSSLTSKGTFTLRFFKEALTSPQILDSFKNTFLLSLSTAFFGVILGFFVALAIVSSPNRMIRNGLTALADVTTNFGGAPLAFAFIVILGSTGVVTLLLKGIGIDLYPNFRIYSLKGLIIAYLYFQIPLMILLITPSIMGIRKSWWEAAINLGATTAQFWSAIAIPYLLPALMSCFLLLFANSFGAYATAWTLTGSDVNLVTIQIGSLIRGEVQVEPELANAIAAIGLAIMGFCVGGYIWLSSKTVRE